MSTIPDRIEKHVNIQAPRSRVWEAIADSGQFGAWFGMRVDGPFTAGRDVQAHITDPPGYEDRPFDLSIERIEDGRHLAFRWPAHEPLPGAGSETVVRTLVEFTLEDAPGGTLLTIVESGFDQVPLEARAKAFSSNDEGWAIQAQNIKRYVESDGR
jgi:uncharacterized protein YndB with AHSA1/START domain